MIDTRRIKNRIFILLSATAFIVTMIPLFWILIEVIYRGASVLSIELLVSVARPPGVPGGGIANFLQGTLILVVMASAIGLPLGLLIGIFLSEFKEHKLAPYVRYFVEVFAEFPAIVIGIFIYLAIVRGGIFSLLGVEKICIAQFCFGATGFSALAGAIALSLLMLPIIARAVEEALNLVPISIKEAAIALGMSKFRMIFTISLSYARSGILLAYILALSRIIGEAAPLVVTVLGSLYWFTSIFDRVGAAPLAIYYYGISPYEDLRAQTWAIALILILAILVLNIGLKFIIRRKFAW